MKDDFNVRPDDGWEGSGFGLGSVRQLNADDGEGQGEQNSRQCGHAAHNRVCLEDDLTAA